MGERGSLPKRRNCSTEADETEVFQGPVQGPGVSTRSMTLRRTAVQYESFKIMPGMQIRAENETAGLVRPWFLLRNEDLNIFSKRGSGIKGMTTSAGIDNAPRTIECAHWAGSSSITEKDADEDYCYQRQLFAVVLRRIHGLPL